MFILFILIAATLLMAMNYFVYRHLILSFLPKKTGLASIAFVNI